LLRTLSLPPSVFSKHHFPALITFKTIVVLTLSKHPSGASGNGMVMSANHKE
jgi:hypothetical protein